MQSGGEERGRGRRRRAEQGRRQISPGERKYNHIIEGGIDVHACICRAV